MGDNDFGICPEMLNSLSNEIKDVLKQYSTELGTEVSIDSFKMLILGQGIEVEQKDFAAEVAATVNQ